MVNILIVDDNQDNRTTIELLLEDFDGVNIEEAQDGSDAVLMCEKKNYDLVFMDIMMPNMDGMEATKKIKSLNNKTMIIAISALDDDESKYTMLHNGAEDYITKPIVSEVFSQRVKNYMKIISMREQSVQTTATVSLFNDTVYPMSKVFTIDSEDSLTYFWDTCLNDTNIKAKNLSDIVRLIYGIGLWLIKTKHKCTIVSEENESNLYLTQSSLGFIDEKIIRNILLKHAQNTTFILKDGVLSFKLDKGIEVLEEEPIVVDEVKTYNQEILSKTHFNKTTALEYVENTAIALMDKIESIETLEDDLDAAIIKFENEPSTDNLQQSSKLFLEYVEVIQQLVEFEHLSHAIASLANFLSGLEQSQLDDKKVKKLATLTINLVSDLSNWRENIFIKKEANDIHYLDSSLLSSCLQIEAIFQEEVSAEENDDDLEFF